MEDFWNRRYEQGKIYGEKPSLCAQEAAGRMQSRLGIEILDVGCGYGRDARWLISKGYKLSGIDVSSRALRMARKNVPTCDFKIGYFQEIPFPDDSFDCIISNLSYNLLNKKERAKAVGEIKRVLRPGGLIVLTVFSVKDPISRAGKEEHPELAEVSYNFDRKLLENEFKDFKILKLECIQVYHKGHPIRGLAPFINPLCEGTGRASSPVRGAVSPSTPSSGSANRKAHRRWSKASTDFAVGPHFHFWYLLVAELPKKGFKII